MQDIIFDTLKFSLLLKDSLEKGYISHKIEKTIKPTLKEKPSTRKNILHEEEVITLEKLGDYPFVKLLEKDKSKRKQKLDMLEEDVKFCQNCLLFSGRQNTVLGQGVLNPVVMVVGEAPGAEEDYSGLPFVGKSGKYLDKWLESINLSRFENAYVTNIIKCRPPKNRPPKVEEIKQCHDYFDRQIAILKPLAILSLGSHASKYITKKPDGITKLRQKTFEYEKTKYFKSQQRVVIFPTYHPSAVLRNNNENNPTYKSQVWENLQRLQSFLKSFVKS